MKRYYVKVSPDELPFGIYKEASCPLLGNSDEFSFSKQYFYCKPERHCKDKEWDTRGVYFFSVKLETIEDCKPITRICHGDTEVQCKWVFQGNLIIYPPP